MVGVVPLEQKDGYEWTGSLQISKFCIATQFIFVARRCFFINYTLLTKFCFYCRRFIQLDRLISTFHIWIHRLRSKMLQGFQSITFILFDWYWFFRSVLACYGGACCQRFLVEWLGFPSFPSLKFLFSWWMYIILLIF